MTVFAARAGSFTDVAADEPADAPTSPRDQPAPLPIDPSPEILPGDEAAVDAPFGRQSVIGLGVENV
jgi:hypothetical protein